MKPQEEVKPHGISVWLPGAPITNDHNVGSSERQKYILTVSQEVQGQGTSRAALPQGCGEDHAGLFQLLAAGEHWRWG